MDMERVPCTAAAVSAVLSKLLRINGDLAFDRFVKAVLERLEGGESAVCNTTVIRTHGYTMDLLPNGFLLDGCDLVDLQDSRDEGTSKYVDEMIAVFRGQAIREMKGDMPGEDDGVLERQLKCAFWLTKAEVMKEAHRVGVPVDGHALEVRHSTQRAAVNFVEHVGVGDIVMAGLVRGRRVAHRTVVYIDIGDEHIAMVVETNNVD